MNPARLLLAALALLLFAGHAAAQTYPSLTGRVVDQAELLAPEQEQALTLRLEALERESGRQLVVATVQSLENITVEAYANGLKSLTTRVYPVSPDALGLQVWADGTLAVKSLDVWRLRSAYR